MNTRRCHRHCGGRAPLTLTLSRGERGRPSAVGRHGLTGEQSAKRGRLLPLPRGEGRGEGETDFDHTPSVGIAARLCRLKPRLQASGGFSLIEIAISMAIIAFALTIIVSILPASMKVGRDVREETLVLADGNYLLEAIRRGAREPNSAVMDALDQVSILGTNVTCGTISNLVQIITTNGGGVTLVMRSLSGAMATQGRANTNMALRYQITPELVRVGNTNLNPELGWTNQLARNLYEMRLTFRWPVLPNLRLVGAPSKKVFRTIVSGAVDADGLLDTAQFR